jgi:branched-chain amino acid transport system substrate-binding protein
MYRSIHKLAASVVGVTLLVAGCASSGGGAGGSAGGSGRTIVKVGVSNPFSGPAAFAGLEAIKGVKLAVADLNARQNKYKFVTYTADDQCTPDGGRAAINQLVLVDKVNVVLASNCSGAVLGSMNVFQQQRVPGVVTAATNPAITAQAGVGGNKYIFRINAMDATMAQQFSKYIVGQGVRKIAFLAPNSDYGRGVVQAFAGDFHKLGVQVTTQQFFVQGGADFRPQLTAIAASGAQAILAPAEYPDAIVILRQMKELGMKQRVFARADVVSLAFLAAAGDPHLGDGVQEATYWDPTLSGDPVFRAKLKEMFGTAPSLNAYVTYWGMKVIYQAILNGGGAQPDQIRNGLQKMDYNTPLGRIKFDAHNQAQSDVFIAGLVNGGIKLIARIQPS